MKINLELSDLELKYIRTLMNQSENKDLLETDPLTIPDKVKTLLDARQCYVEMFGYQYHEEKEMLPELQKGFDYLVKK